MFAEEKKREGKDKTGRREVQTEGREEKRIKKCM